MVGGSHSGSRSRSGAGSVVNRCAGVIASAALRAWCGRDGVESVPLARAGQVDVTALGTEAGGYFMRGRCAA